MKEEREAVCCEEKKTDRMTNARWNQSSLKHDLVRRALARHEATVR
jgi:hypothetical protein